jgi:hypothetical protein
LTLWALLLLPLVAVGVAVTLMVSWGGSGAQAAGAGTDMNLYGMGGACDTDPASAAPAKCSVPVGTNVIVKVQLDKFTIAGWNGAQARLTDTANLTFVPLGAETLCADALDNDPKPDGFVNDGCPSVGPGESGANCANATNDDADSVVNDGCPTVETWQKNCSGGIVASSGGDGDFTAACAIGIGQALRSDTGNLFEMHYDCTTQGAGNVTMVNGNPPDSHITDGNLSPVPEANPTDVLAINCTPPDRQIQINKTDVDTAGFVGPTCWQLFVLVNTFPNGPLSDPVPLNVPVDVVGDNGKVCGGIGAFSDKNLALGQIDITISGAVRVAAGSDEWHVLETQAPPKYTITNLTKLTCDLSQADCVVNVTNQRISGNINVSYNDTVTGQPLAGQCVNVYSDPPTNAVLVGNFCGAIPAQPLGDYGVELDPTNVPVDRQAKAPTKVLCDLTAQTPKCSVKFDFNPTIPFNLKVPTLANLFLTAQGSKLPPTTCASSTNVQTYSHDLSNAPVSADPKDPTATQQVGGFEMNVLFDEDLICVNLAAGAYWTGTAGAVCFIDDKDQGLQPDGLARIGCVIKGKPATVSSSLQLAVITVRPQPELYSLITADQDNGVNAQILNSGCNLSDMQGHPIKKIGCDDSEVTIRWLEGDVNGDCAVNVRDQQILAFRWGAEIGSGALYNPRFDLEPSGQINNDGDIDIKDVQFVYGRHGSVCVKGGLNLPGGPYIWPDQPPRNEKLTNPLP